MIRAIGFDLDDTPYPAFLNNFLLELLQSDPDSVLFVGDNPDKDCSGSHGAGMKYTQIRSAGSDWERMSEIRKEEPEIKIDALFQLPPILRKLNGNERN